LADIVSDQDNGPIVVVVVVVVGNRRDVDVIMLTSFLGVKRRKDCRPSTQFSNRSSSVSINSTRLVDVASRQNRTWNSLSSMAIAIATTTNTSF
jgi:hypothetical protein